MDDQSDLPSAVLACDPRSYAEKGNSEAKLEVREPERERRGRQRQQRPEPCHLVPALDRPFEGDRTGDDEHLRAEEEKSRRSLYFQESRELRDDQIHREIGVERKRDLIIGIRVRSPGIRQKMHSGEMVQVIRHCRNIDEQRRQQRERSEQNDGAPGGLHWNFLYVRRTIGGTPIDPRRPGMGACQSPKPAF